MKRLVRRCSRKTYREEVAIAREEVLVGELCLDSSQLILPSGAMLRAGESMEPCVVGI